MTTATKPKVTRPRGAERASLRAEAVRLYEGGKSIREVRLLMNRSYGYIHNLLTEASARGEVTIRARGIYPRGQASGTGT